MMPLFLGHLADRNRRVDRLGKVLETISTLQERYAPVLGVVALAHGPSLFELGEKRRDLLGGQRRYAPAARDAGTFCEVAHGRAASFVAGAFPARAAAERSRVATNDGAVRRKAAVAIAIFRRAPHGVVFVERAAHLRDHPGQIGLPGGSVHAEDRDLQATALRELHEEVGIEPSQVTIVAELPQLSQRFVNNFDVTPFVAVVEPAELRIDPSETAAVFVVPLETILERGVREGSVEHLGMRLQSLVLDYEDRRIWGLTARILHSFLEAWERGDLRSRVMPQLIS